MSERLTNRDHLTYLCGAAIIATVLSVGIGLIAGAGWKQVLGSSMVLGLVFYAVTIEHLAERNQ